MTYGPAASYSHATFPLKFDFRSEKLSQTWRPFYGIPVVPLPPFCRYISLYDFRRQQSSADTVSLLQEIVSIYPMLSPPTLTAGASNRVCNALALLQVRSRRVDLFPSLPSAVLDICAPVPDPLPVACSVWRPIRKRGLSFSQLTFPSTSTLSSTQ